MSGIFAFRADASVQIGTGHVMRCLTLADALAAEGHGCHFLCHALEGHLADAIIARGHRVHWLGGPDDAPFTPRPGDPLHAHWLPTLWETDAAQSAQILAALRPDWLIVDHYALDRRWQQAAAPAGTQILAIDDLADRPHAAHLLLDQNLGRRAADYDGLLPDHAIRLIGPAHALLRPDFAAWRPASLARRAEVTIPRRLLISLGGVDAGNATGAVLDVLAHCPLAGDCAVDVVMGAHAPWLDAVRAQAAAMPCPTQVLVNVADMAELMATADLAIGAAGGTSWERCCLGLPTLILTLADNQRPAATALDAAGAGILLGASDGDDWRERLTQALAATQTDAALLQHLSAHAAAICDGGGTAQLCQFLATGPSA